MVRSNESLNNKSNENKEKPPTERLRKIEKAIAWGRLAEYAFDMYFDRNVPAKKRAKALELAKRFYNRAFELLEE